MHALEIHIVIWPKGGGGGVFIFFYKERTFWQSQTPKNMILYGSWSDSIYSQKCHITGTQQDGAPDS